MNNPLKVKVLLPHFDLKVIDSPQADLGVARCLKSLGHTVYGADDTPFVTTSDLFHKTFIIEEIRTLNLDNLLKRLISLKDLYGIEYIIPCYDETVILFSYIKDKLDYIGIKLMAPELSVIKSLRKENLDTVFQFPTLTTPSTKAINSIQEAEKFADEIEYPVFVKGMTKGAIFASNKNELENAIKKVCGIWNNGEIHCLVQKAINGKFINALFTYKNAKIVAYTEMEKIGLDMNVLIWKKSIKTLFITKI